MKLLKKDLFTVLIYIFLFEVMFQIFFILNLKFIKQPILFYNGYCDQKYWNMIDMQMKFNEDFLPHPILSYQKEGIFIPNNFIGDNSIEKSIFSNKEISFYGDSYMNHPEVKKIISNFKGINFTNYAFESYGLDQIYLNYKLTGHLNQNRTIVFGFLLEDLDRSIFKFREYHKAIFVQKDGEFVLSNSPVKQNVDVKRNNDFYLFKFLHNFYKLIKNDFDPRLSKCKIDYKKNLFNYFFNDIQSDAKKFNQKIIVITFNLKEDLRKKPSWRYEFIKDYLSENNIVHIDSLQIMQRKSDIYSESFENYFGTDDHNNKKSFEYIFAEFKKVL